MARGLLDYVLPLGHGSFPALGVPRQAPAAPPKSLWPGEHRQAQDCPGKPRHCPCIAHALPMHGHAHACPGSAQAQPRWCPGGAQAVPGLSPGGQALAVPRLGRGRQGVGGLRRIDFGGYPGLNFNSTPQECTGYFLQIHNKKIILLMKEGTMDEFMKYVPLAVLALLVVHMLLF